MPERKKPYEVSEKVQAFFDSLTTGKLQSLGPAKTEQEQVTREMLFNLRIARERELLTRISMALNRFVFQETGRRVRDKYRAENVEAQILEAMWQRKLIEMVERECKVSGMISAKKYGQLREMAKAGKRLRKWPLLEDDYTSSCGLADDN